MKRKVVIVDDELENLDVLAELLTGDTYEVITFASPQDGLSYINANADIRLVILDYTMPVMNGEKLLESLRSSGNMVPTIFLSGNIDNEFLLAAIRLGASDVLEKPSGIVNIVAIVDRIIEIEKRKANYYKSQDSLAGTGKILGLMQAQNNLQNKAITK